jgi:hypothetical protein
MIKSSVRHLPSSISTPNPEALRFTKLKYEVMLGAAEGGLMRAAASTLTFGE